MIFNVNSEAFNETQGLMCLCKWSHIYKISLADVFILSPESKRPQLSNSGIKLTEIYI